MSISSKLVMIPLFLFPLVANAAQPIIDVYKTASCGCCKKWVQHLQSNGFEVRAHDVKDPAVIRRAGGIADKYGSCHTARVGKYIVEGHVPASDIKRLLSTRPRAVGLAVPGMPMGSPGMEGGRSDSYDVLLVKEGSAAVYKSYR